LTNKINQKTRRNISDELKISKIQYSGVLEEQEFLSRIFDLKQLPSNDARYKTAFDDIWKHMTMNNDWQPDWVFLDIRFNLLHCDDALFLDFLCETIHPAVRIDEVEINKILDIYNRHLESSGYEIVENGVISERPIFKSNLIVITDTNKTKNHTVIKKYLNTDYVNSRIELMNKSLQNDTDLAIGTSKELIEIICKSILKQLNITIDKNWDLLRLVKETNKVLDFKPKNASNPEDAERSIKQILGGISSIIQGITELRNNYGSGHGKDADFRSLETRYARFVVGLVSELAVFYLHTNGERTELAE